MQPTQTLTPDQAFFFKHAGYSHNPKTETPEQGRTRCAIALAEAEALYMQAHRVADVGIEWAEEDPRALGYRKGKDYKDSLEMATVWHREASGEVNYLAHLGGISDAGINYRRVIRAELAHECADQLRVIIAGA